MKKGGSEDAALCFVIGSRGDLRDLGQRVAIGADCSVNVSHHPVGGGFVAGDARAEPALVPFVFASSEAPDAPFGDQEPLRPDIATNTISGIHPPANHFRITELRR